MANLSFLKRLVQEDFDAKDRSLISKISYVLNPAIQQLVNIFNKGLNVSDLNTQYKTLTLIVDSTGVPTSTLQFTSSLNGICTQILVGRALNLTNSTTYPTSGVIVSFTNSQGNIVINHITGLTSGDKWELTLTAYV